MAFENEIHKRKTFAIISHPDAGKTTLTEKFLLYGGAIQTAGAVKSNKIKKTATSDFMEIEKQRGISVATSVMSFEYKDTIINLLDTPGHKDFAEDTYRTLTAVDSVILVIDSVKGVEEQTEKLSAVCRMRNTPIIIFINKMDREGKNPFDLLDEIEQKLNIKTVPLSWPLGAGSSFRGVYNIYENKILLFEPNKTKVEDEVIVIEGINDPDIDKLLPAYVDKLREDFDCITGIFDKFDKEKYLTGEQSPVFFGSALNNFGVKELLNTFIEIAPTPKDRETTVGMISPYDEKFSGFVFKIHANLDPKHRDRIAFLRVCSGKFERNKSFYHVRLKRQIKFAAPYSFMASRKNVLDEAYPGDVVGLYDTGNFKIGDTLTEGDEFLFKGIPSFSPEIFKELNNLDPLKSKQLEKGIKQLTDEGVAQLFSMINSNRIIVGTVGELQFEVIQYRLLQEYGASCRFSPLSFVKAIWVDYDPKYEDEFKEFSRLKGQNLAKDKFGSIVFLASSQWELDRTIEKFSHLNFRFSAEHNIGELVEE